MSMEQKKYMVDYMAEDLDFANNRFQLLRGKELQKQKWIDLSNALNALGGATKTPEQWELSWRDLRQKTKTKWMGIRNRQSGENGLVKKKRDILSELEKMILAVMQKDTLDGDGKTQEGGFNEPVRQYAFISHCRFTQRDFYQTLPVNLNADDDAPEQSQDDVYHEANIEFLDEEFGNIHASSSEMPCELTEILTSSAPSSTPAGREYEDPAPAPPVIQGTATRPRTIATPSRGRQLGRGQRYSETAMQNMESQVFKSLETMQADKKEHMKRKLELHEKMLIIEERKLAIKQKKVDALNSVNESLQALFNRN